MPSNIHAIILARGGSKGIKNKNLINVNNRPLIYWSIKSCLSTKNIKKVWVSSDNLKILKLSEKFGASVIQRPKHLSSDNSSSESGWIHAFNEIKKKEKIDYVSKFISNILLSLRGSIYFSLKRLIISRNFKTR